MPPDTIWSANSQFLQGSVPYDDPGTTYDAAIPYDAPQANLIDQPPINDTLYTTGTE